MKLNVDISNKIASDSSGYVKKQVDSIKIEPVLLKSGTVSISEMTDLNGNPTKEAYKVAVNKLNEFMETTNKNSNFVFHENLERYYVQLVDSTTQEVVKEIPPKELLDAYYEMQKLVGKIFDTQA